MEIFEQIFLNDCPICGSGGGLLEEDIDLYYVMCPECGCHTVSVDFFADSERLDAAKRAAMLWNVGKVISSSPGE